MDPGALIGLPDQGEALILRAGKKRYCRILAR
jgi:hypothetical protein